MTRTDGRAPADLRDRRVTPGSSRTPKARCSSRSGRTRVICTASVEDRVPPFLRNTGKGWVTAEYGMLPRATITRTQREATRGQGRRPHAGDPAADRPVAALGRRSLTELGERTIWIDCDVIQADGGTRTASITGGFVALVLALQKLKRARRCSRTMPRQRLRRRDQRRHRRRRRRCSTSPTTRTRAPTST